MKGHDAIIARALGGQARESSPVPGGCIHQARRLELADGRLAFVKSAADPQGAALLAGEARGLQLLRAHIRCPAILDQGPLPDGGAWLALEWLDLHPLGTPAWRDLGRALAGLHQTHAKLHGLDFDHFLGRLPLENSPCASWAEFFIERRLRPQFALARRRGHRGLEESHAIERAATLLANHQPRASLLHGDLWTGNAAALADGSAVVFDPAPYFGDPETDLAMLELFGSPLPAAFFEGYPPPDPARERRRPLYDLHHALNHLNHFGESYRPLVRRCLASLA